MALLMGGYLPRISEAREGDFIPQRTLIKTFLRDLDLGTITMNLKPIFTNKSLK